MKLEAMERNQRRKFELEMMRLRSNTGACVPYFTQVMSLLHFYDHFILAITKRFEYIERLA